jgi:trans-2,3-dihydro-3-hydroxyanthranilate isomerase
MIPSLRQGANFCMKKTAFHIVDVFAEKKYAGNQLAVIRNAANLSSDEMQQIAREINFSETTFILSDKPAKNDGFDVRIYTPKEEVPFAGHPTIGTAYIIRNEILQGKTDNVVLNLKVGQIPVRFSKDGYCWMKQIEPTFGPQHKPEILASVLGLDVAAFDERYPIEEVSTGLPFFIVPLKTITALKKAAIDKEKYFNLIKETTAKGILIFCPDTHESQNDISVRVFVEYYGVPEDPATGSGNGCLSGYLVKYRYFGTDNINIRSEQGYEIGRPSLLLLKATQSDLSLDIQVGGKCIIIAQGEFI